MRIHRSALVILAAAALLAPVPVLALQQGTFVLLTATGDTLSIERFSRSPERLESELLIKAAGARFTMGLTLGAGATVTRFENEYRQASADPASPPLQSAVITFSGDSAFAEIGSGDRKVVQRIGSRGNSIPFVNPSFALTEQMLRRARVLGGSPVTVPVFVVQGGTTVDFRVTWLGADSAVIEMGGVPARVAVDADGSILGGVIPAQGLRLVRGAHTTAPLSVARPDYRAPEGAPYTSEDVEVRTAGGFVLAGTLTMPMGAKGSVPAFVTITGSGLQDRDAALPMVKGYALYRQVADTLARHGVAVLRMDDRGFGASGGIAAGATTVDFADDIRAGLAWLRQHRGIDARRLGLIGHSEGGIIAPMIAASDTSLRGIVIMAGPAWTGRRVVEWQNAYVLATSAQVAPSQRDSLLTASMRIADAAMQRDAWGRFFASYDPLPTARRVKAPVLVLHGETDQQVTVAQAGELAAALRAGGNRDVTVRTFPATNHLFLADSVGHWANYSQLASGTVRPEVLGALVDWVRGRFSPPGNGRHSR